MLCKQCPLGRYFPHPWPTTGLGPDTDYGHCRLCPQGLVANPGYNGMYDTTQCTKCPFPADRVADVGACESAVASLADPAYGSVLVASATDASGKISGFKREYCARDYSCIRGR